MNGYILGVGIAGGLILSQTVRFMVKIYDLLVESEKKRDKSLQDLIDKSCVKLDTLSESLQKQAKDHNEKQWEFLREKANVMDKKMSLVLTKVTGSSDTSKGVYKTIIGMEEKAHKQARMMSDVIDEGAGVLSNNYKDLLEKYGDRKEVVEDEHNGLMPITTETILNIVRERMTT